MVVAILILRTREATLGMEQTPASAKCRYFTFIRQ